MNKTFWRKTMKSLKILALMLALVLSVAAFAACGETTTEPAKKPADSTAAPQGGETTEAPQGGETTEAPADSESAEDTDDGETTEAEDDDSVLNIGSREELFAFADSILVDYETYSDMTINITADIDLTPTLEGGRNWTPLDGEFLEYVTINGNGHIINGMTITPDELAAIDMNYGYGFIGHAKYDLEILDITFTNAVITSIGKHVGCVIGEVSAYVTLDNVTVDNLWLNGGVGTWESLDNISFRVGGLIGSSAFGGDIEVANCTVKNSKIIGFHNVSGLVGNVAPGCYDFEGNKVENTNLHYSAGFSNSYDQGVARYFADPFYCVNDEWEVYHGDEDAELQNSFTNLTSYDMAYDVTYKDAEGKTADYAGEFPV